jgi:hypothetical protein
MMTRRTNLMLLAAGASLTGSRALAAPTPFPSTPAERLRAFVRMRGALDDRLVIGCIRGRYEGVIDGETTPLFGVTAATFARWRPHGDGYEVIGFEQAYFTDLQTNQVLDTFVNPYTGERVAVPVTAMPPSRLLLGADLSLRPAAVPPGMTLGVSVSPPEQIGDDVIFVERNRAAMPVSPTRRFFYNDTTAMRAKLHDLSSSDAARVPCQTSFQSILSWRPWLHMGDRPGQMCGFGQGLYGVSIEHLPDNWIEATRRIRPELLVYPEAVIEPLWRAA